MKSIKGLCCGVILLAMVGCAPRQPADNLARKEIQPPKAPPPAPKAVATPIDQQLREKAIAELDTNLASADPVLRANAIEAFQNANGVDARGRIMKALVDASPLVRFAGAMAAGTLQMRDAMPAIRDLVEDANPSVRVAARFALHKLGDTHLSHDLEKTAQSPSLAVRGNTALALGNLGEKSATKILEPMLNDSSPAVRIQAAEALWKLGSQLGMVNLVTASVSQAPDDQIIALLALAAPKDERVSGVIYGKLVADYAEVSLAAARAMGTLGSDSGYAVAMQGVQSPYARQRSLGALALGSIGRSDAQPALAKALADKDANVRLAAATAILQLKDSAKS